LLPQKRTREGNNDSSYDSIDEVLKRKKTKGKPSLLIRVDELKPEQKTKTNKPSSA